MPVSYYRQAFFSIPSQAAKIAIDQAAFGIYATFCYFLSEKKLIRYSNYPQQKKN